jgi:Flp pilus assembly pilin Flp
LLNIVELVRWSYLTMVLRSRLNADERGATMVEYALIVGLIAGVSTAVLFALGGNVHTIFNHVQTCVASPGTGSC